MLRKKSKKDYLVPHAIVTEVDLEGLICLSAYKAVNVDEIHNINSMKKADGTTVEPLYFEF